jgi:hypothetical protein
VNQDKTEQTSESDYGSECLVLIDGQKVKARVVHIGRGKFKILNEGVNRTHVGKIVDAADIVHCRAEA